MEKRIVLLILLSFLNTHICLAEVTFTSNATIGTSDPNYEDEEIIVNGCTLAVDGGHSFNSLRVTNGGIVTHSMPVSGVPGPGIDLTIAQDVVVEYGSKLTANARGYGAGAGPGAGGAGDPSYGGGGGYGGDGGKASTGTAGGFGYGWLTAPNGFGSGGGNHGGNKGGSGGGLIRLAVGGTLTVDGVLSANGQNYQGTYAGGGAGGGIYITTAQLTGSGSISADGGNGYGSYGGGGGGGRIALHFQNSTFMGAVSAKGGAGSEVGGAGTIYTKPSGQARGDLKLYNGGTLGSYTRMLESGEFGRIDVANQAKATFSNPGLLVSCEQVSVNDARLVVWVSDVLEMEALAVGNGAIVWLDGRVTCGTVQVQSGGAMTHSVGKNGFHLNVTGDLDVEEGGHVRADGTGYGSGEGPGAGSPGEPSYGGGGAYAGDGGKASTGTPGGRGYGSVTAPNDIGSGGGNHGSYEGGGGGGCLRITVGGELTLDGIISANGQDYRGSNAGGGSGGGIHVTAGRLTGSGSISADGGNGYSNRGGGGGGGRIALYFGENAFTGTISAKGGAGSEVGGAGTIYTKPSGQARGDLKLDNAGNNGACTRLLTSGLFGRMDISGKARVWIVDVPLSINCREALVKDAGLTVTVSDALELENLIVATGGGVWLGGRVTCGNVQIQSGGSAVSSTLEYGFDLNVTGDLDVEAGGSIIADGRGYGSAEGPGAGRSGEPSYGGGGGYGGAGGDASTGTSGGSDYGFMMEPVDCGSGGGNHGNNQGGYGGGCLRMTVAGELTLDGVLSANGQDYKGSYAGGGSGGSIHVTAGRLTGAGQISANGGNGYGGYGGGGGGGRIALYCRDSIRFPLRNVTVKGGSGGHAGKDGTFWLVRPGQAPVVTAVSPSRIVSADVNHVDINFAWGIEPKSLSADDIEIVGPQGQIQISDVGFHQESVGRQTYRATFDSLTADGQYSISVGPGIQAVDGRGLDQDRDGVEGELLDDVYHGSWEFDRTGPKVERHEVAGDKDGSGKCVYVWFDEPVDEESISVEDVNIVQVDALAHSTNSGTMWMSAAGNVTQQHVTFDLAESRVLKSIRIWNYNEAGQTARGVKELDVLVSDNDANYVSVGTFTLNRAPGTANVDFSQVIFVGPVAGRYVKFVVKANYGDGNYVGLAEVRFSGDAEIEGVSVAGVSSEYKNDGRLAVKMVDGTGLQDINVTPALELFGGDCLRIAFESSATVNRVFLGPQIRDIAGNEMDQNGNGRMGELPEDVYDAGFETPDVILKNVLSVDDDGAADFESIQAAIDYATDGDIIEVGPGVYEENIDFKGKTITVRKVGSAGPGDFGLSELALMSESWLLESGDPGFREEFDLVEDGTIDFLDFAVFASGWAQPVLARGQPRAIGPTGEVVIRAAGKDGVTFTSGEGSGAVLDGIVIEQGRYGIYCSNSSPSIRNCTVKNSSSYGIYCVNSSPKVVGCETVNTASHGLYCNSCPGIVITDSSFVGSAAHGLYCNSSASASIERCSASDSAQMGIICESSPDSSVVDCVSTGNGTHGFYAHVASSVRIADCKAENNGKIGFYCNSSASANIEGCTGAANGDAGLYCQSSADVKITACTLSHNTGTGLNCSGSSPSVSNCVVAHNGNYGVTCSGSSPSIVNCTIVNNTGRGVSQSAGPIANCIIWNNGDDLFESSATYSCISDGDRGAGNSAYSPYFVDSASGDYHLASYSPCIDAGDPNAEYGNEPGAGVAVNLGAYGNTSQACQASADVDKDGLPDDWELLQWPGDPTLAMGPMDDADGDGLKNLVEYQMGWDPVMMSEIVVNQSTGLSYRDIQMAITFARDGEVLVAYPGVYVGRLNFSGKRIRLQSVDPKNASVVANTVIDSHGADGITFNSGEDPNAALEGFTIINSDTGIVCSGASPTIANCVVAVSSKDGLYAKNAAQVVSDCVFSESARYGVYLDSCPNSLIKDCAVADCGNHGIFCNKSDSTTIDGVTVTGCRNFGIYAATCPGVVISDSAVVGSANHGLYCNGCASASITGCRAENGAQMGIVCESSADAVISDCLAARNASYGLYANAAASVAISGCTIENNRNIGLYCRSSASAKIEGCASTNNTSDGLYCHSSADVGIKACTLSNNGNYGLNCASSSPSVTNCVIADNDKYGVACSSSSPSIAACTIVNNTGRGVSQSGGPIANCIIWNNGDDLFESGATYSCIGDGDSGLGNLGYHPYFVGAGAGDYHLASYSPCIDAGDPNSEYADEPDGGGGRINLGAYGNTPEACRGSADVDVDGLPDDWERFHWPEDQMLSAGPRDDSDGDGLENLAEYQVGWLPRTAEQYYGHVLNATSDLSYPSIAAALACAAAADEIVVAEGVYRERVNFSGKPLTLRSSDPSNTVWVANTIIDASGGVGVTFDSGEQAGSVLNGFTITNSSDGILCTGASPTIRNCVVRNSSGYGIYCKNASPEIISCQAVLNGSHGIYCESSANATISTCLLADNSGSGLYCNSSSPSVYNTVIAHNNAHGILCSSSSPTIAECTIVRNASRGISQSGGTAINCILWENGDDLYGCEAKFSCVSDGDAGLGNFNADPRFVDADNLDYHLAPDSPCVDAGAPWSQYALEPAPNGGRVNIGCYGNIPDATPTVDDDGDGLADAWELRYWPNDPNLTRKPEEDADGDGFTNWAEYLFGYDPTVETEESIQIPYIKLRPDRFAPISCIDPTEGESCEIEYAVTMDCNVTVLVTEPASGNTVRQLSQTVIAGLNKIAWDGTDANQVLVPDGFYDVTVTAEFDSANVCQWGSVNWANSSPALQNMVFDVAGFDAHKNLPARIDFDLTDWAKLLMRVDCSGRSAYIYMNNDVILKPGHHTYYWNGRDGDGRVHDGSYSLYFGILQGTHKGAVFVESVPPRASGLLCNAYRIVPTYNEVSTIKYDLTEDADVTIVLDDPDGSHCVTLLEGVRQQAGSREVIWDGKSAGGNYIWVEGVYNVSVLTAEPNYPGVYFEASGAISAYK